MFANPRLRKAIPKPLVKKRKRIPTIEEIEFNFGAREEYLTGFHKRKQQRIKQAQAEADKKARQERIEIRKQIREDRQRQVEDHLKHVDDLLQQHEDAGRISADERSEEEDGNDTAKDTDQAIDSQAEWLGLDDEPPGGIEEELDDHEEEYIDEDKYTKVTVESVTVTRHGLGTKKAEEEDEEGDGQAEPDKSQASKPSYAKVWPKKKKKKFTYQTKYERQLEGKKRKAKRLKKMASE